MIKETIKLILISVACMCVADISSRFVNDDNIKHTMFFSAGMIYMAILWYRDQRDKQDNTVTFTDKEKGKIDAAYNTRKDYNKMGG